MVLALRGHCMANNALIYDLLIIVMALPTVDAEEQVSACAPRVVIRRRHCVLSNGCPDLLARERAIANYRDHAHGFN